MKTLSRFALGTLAFLAVNTPQMAGACSVCMGDPNSNAARGANAVLFLMLGILAGMFGLLGAFGYYLYRRSQMPVPPHEELGHFVDAQPEGGLN
jgi:hypothetical protein